SKIAIPIFSNQTFKYGLEQTLTDSIINEFISDGRLHVVGPNEADVVLSGEIVSYLKDTPSEVTPTLEENRIRIELLVSLVSKKEKKTIKERKIEEVFAYSSSEVGGIQTEDEAVETACKEIAEKMVDAITWDLGFPPI
ncbi:MAG: LptE family protein, partial [bacterium]